MTVNLGRTVSRFVDFRVGDINGVIRSIPIDTLNGVGVTYEEADVTAFQDAIRNALAGKDSTSITVGGPFDTSALQTPSGSGVPAGDGLSGSFTVLKDIVGDGTPRTLDILIGIRHPWETGEPHWGISGVGGSTGFLCTEFSTDTSSMKYSAKFALYGTQKPDWSLSGLYA